jgi:hypothetical protein
MFQFSNYTSWYLFLVKVLLPQNCETQSCILPCQHIRNFNISQNLDCSETQVCQILRRVTSFRLNAERKIQISLTSHVVMSRRIKGAVKKTTRLFYFVMLSCNLDQFELPLNIAHLDCR